MLASSKCSLSRKVEKGFYLSGFRCTCWASSLFEVSTVCVKHIPHQFSKEMAKKTEEGNHPKALSKQKLTLKKTIIAIIFNMWSFSCFYFHKVLLGVISKSENKSEEMPDILKQIRGYSPNFENADQTLRKSIPIVGDQLTVERGVNVIQAVQSILHSRRKIRGHPHGNCWLAYCCYFLECKGMQYFLMLNLYTVFENAIHTSLRFHSQAQKIQTILRRLHINIIDNTKK